MDVLLTGFCAGVIAGTLFCGLGVVIGTLLAGGQ